MKIMATNTELCLRKDPILKMNIIRPQKLDWIENEQTVHQ